MTVGQIYTAAGTDSPLSAIAHLVRLRADLRHDWDDGADDRRFWLRQVELHDRATVAHGSVERLRKASRPIGSPPRTPRRRWSTQLPSSILQATNAQTLIQQIFDENEALPASLLAPVLASRYFGPNSHNLEPHV